MGTSKNKLVLAICITILVVGAVFATVLIVQHVSYQREQRAEEAEQRRIAETYIRLHYAFWMVGGVEEFGIEWTIDYERGGEYKPFSELNEFGINVFSYLFLKKYELETGNTLSFEVVLDYFSEEFETDGLLRLYNNGRHPEIQAFVEWMWEGQRLRDMIDFFWRVEAIEILYRHEHRNQSYNVQNFLHLSPQMLDALFRAYTDPDYVLDLTSLQQAGY